MCLLCFLTTVSDGGDLYSWGLGTSGQLGLGKDESDCSMVEVHDAHKVDIKGNVRQAACGECHSLVCLDDGSVYSWGFGRYGQLGHGDDMSLFKPRRIASTPIPHKVRSVSASYYSSYATTCELPLCGAPAVHAPSLSAR